jgi:GT2 family glycosyltransferase
MTSSDRVTVAIATRDRPEALARCLASLASGRRRPDDVVVVDQSTDSATTRVVERSGGGSLTIQYERHATAGLGVAQNAAFARATHPLVAVLDDDCVADPGWLDIIVSLLSVRPDLDGVTGRVLPADPVGARTFAVSSRTSEVGAEFSGRALPWEVGSGNNFALRKSAFERVGGCDPRLGPGAVAQGGVDMDLFHRLLRSGSRIRYEPQAIVFHDRQTRGERAARRPMYGRGMGAAIALWHRSGDGSSGVVLREWVRLRLRQMRGAAARGDWSGISEEVTVLASTARGLAQGWRLGRR